MQSLDCPEKYSLSLGAHFLGDIRVVDSVRGLVLCREDDLPTEETDASVVQTLQRSVAKSNKADVQVSLIALLSLALQIHRKLRCDDRLDVVCLRESFQLHVVVEQQQLVLKIGSGERACLDLRDAPGIHIRAEQRAQNQSYTRFSLTAFADQEKHFLSLCRWNEAVAHELLQGQNVVRFKKLR